MIASEGPPVDSEAANAAPIINVSAPPLGPQLTSTPIPGLPPELQPAPGDVLLSRAFWPWSDLGAEGIPEHWLYMSRHVQGVIAMLSVQTPSGPKLVQADSSGRFIPANYYDRNAIPKQIAAVNVVGPHGFTTRNTYTVPVGRKAVIETIALAVMRSAAAAPADETEAFAFINSGGVGGYLLLDFIDNTVGAARQQAVGQAGFLRAADYVTIGDMDLSTGGTVTFSEMIRLTEFDA